MIGTIITLLVLLSCSILCCFLSVMAIKQFTPTEMLPDAVEEVLEKIPDYDDIKDLIDKDDN